jgi:hypothetical protein
MEEYFTTTENVMSDVVFELKKSKVWSSLCEAELWFPATENLPETKIIFPRMRKHIPDFLEAFREDAEYLTALRDTCWQAKEAKQHLPETDPALRERFARCIILSYLAENMLWAEVVPYSGEDESRIKNFKRNTRSSFEAAVIRGEKGSEEYIKTRDGAHIYIDTLSKIAADADLASSYADNLHVRRSAPLFE